MSWSVVTSSMDWIDITLRYVCDARGDSASMMKMERIFNKRSISLMSNFSMFYKFNESLSPHFSFSLPPLFRPHWRKFSNGRKFRKYILDNLTHYHRFSLCVNYATCIVCLISDHLNHRIFKCNITETLNPWAFCRETRQLAIWYKYTTPYKSGYEITKVIQWSEQNDCLMSLEHILRIFVKSTTCHVYFDGFGQSKNGIILNGPKSSTYCTPVESQ